MQYAQQFIVYIIDYVSDALQLPVHFQNTSFTIEYCLKTETIKPTPSLAFIYFLSCHRFET